MKAKKIIALVLALVLCLCALVGCQKADPTTTTNPAETTKPAETTQPAETTAPAETTEPAPLLNKDIYPISSDHTFVVATNNTKIDTATNWHLMVDTIGLDVEWRVVAAEQVPLLFVGDSKDMPDIFMQSGGVSVQQIQEYGQAGLLVNFMDYIDQMPNLKAFWEGHPDLLVSVQDADGNFYNLPQYSKHTTQASNLFYVRTDLTKAAGIDELPTTVEGFLDMCATVKEYYKDTEGFIPIAANGSWDVTYAGTYAQIFFPAFGDLLIPDFHSTDGEKIEAGFATEQFKRYITFMRTLYAEGYLDSECFTHTSQETKALTNEGLVAMHPHATQLTPEMFPSGKMDFQVYPVMSSQYQSERRFVMPNHYSTSTMMISSTCPDIDAAIKFMDAFYAPLDNPLDEAGTVNCWTPEMGALGVDYIINEEEGWYSINEHEGFDSASAWLQVAGTGWALAREWDYYENSGTGLMVKAIGYVEDLLPYGVYPVRTNMLKLTQDEQDIYTDTWTDLKKYLAEMNAAFITGQKDIDAEWDTYIQTLDNMGLQDIIGIYQAALDRYNAR